MRDEIQYTHQKVWFYFYSTKILILIKFCIRFEACAVKSDLLRKALAQQMDIAGSEVEAKFHQETFASVEQDAI